MKRAWLMVIVAVVGVGSASAQQKNPVYTDPAKAGFDWQIQGEYVGTMAGKKLGAEVIARGFGKFDVNFLPGGLRGEGGEYARRIVAKGQREKNRVRIEGIKRKWSAVIAEGNMEGKSEDGASFTLKKIIRKSPTLGKEPPEGAVVLYRSPKDVINWINGKVVDGNLLGNGCVSKRKFGDHTLHLEFRLSFMPTRRGQARSNSGVYVQGRYEVQVLDSFGLSGASNECGGIYGVAKPKVNMCFPPLTWQTYDIEFRAARFDADGKKIKNATITVRHNGVVIHENVEFKRGTTGGARLRESPEPGPLYLQHHGGQVQYRNIWVVENKAR